MSLSRRKFLGWIGAAGMTAAAGRKASAATTHHFEGHPDSMAVLHDTTLCIGCRQCEGACNAVNDLPAPEVPFTDLSVLDNRRRTTSKAYTVVNQTPGSGKRPCFLKKSVQPLPGARLRLGMLRQGLYEDQGRRRGIRRIGLCGLPLLHDRLPV
jgi:ferredoxin